MFLEDELEYVRLKRTDNIMGWIAIAFVAVLVFMFAGLMNTASASDNSPLRSPHATYGHLVETAPPGIGPERLFVPASLTGLISHSGDMALATPQPDAASPQTQITIDPIKTNSIPATAASFGDRDIFMGLMMIAFSLMGSSFLLLAFGGPRGTRASEDQADGF